MPLMSPMSSASSGPVILEIDTDAGVIDVRLMPRRDAKRLTLRLDAKDGQAKLTVPPRYRETQVRRFLEQHADWIIQQQAKRRPPIVVENGAVLPFAGRDISLRLTGMPPRTVQLGGHEIIIGGPTDMALERLLKYLKTEAKKRLLEAVNHYAEKLGKSPSRVTVRDTSSRWGSCSSRGAISLSWRLILAPDEVLHYVAAHEVAHLAEMNHGPNFWRKVDHLYPDWGQARGWLKRHGRDLLAVQFIAAPDETGV